MPKRLANKDEITLVLKELAKKPSDRKIDREKLAETQLLFLDMLGEIIPYQVFAQLESEIEELFRSECERDLSDRKNTELQANVKGSLESTGRLMEGEMVSNSQGIMALTACTHIASLALSTKLA